jgi:hypothetical protein
MGVQEATEIYQNRAGSLRDNNSDQDKMVETTTDFIK